MQKHEYQLKELAYTEDSSSSDSHSHRENGKA